MSEETPTATIHEIPVKKPRKPYTRQAKAPESLPIAPAQAVNPNVFAMEAKITELVEMRSHLQQMISVANQKLQMAQYELKSVQDNFSQIEAEISYRMNLVSQMRGGPAIAPPPQQPPWQPAPNINPFTNGSPFAPYGQVPQSPPYAPAQPYPQYPPAFDARMPVGSYPANNRGLHPDVVGDNEGAIRGSAEETRFEEMKNRGY